MTTTDLSVLCQLDLDCDDDYMEGYLIQSYRIIPEEEVHPQCVYIPHSLSAC